MEALGPLQDEVMAAAEDLRKLLPGEKGLSRTRTALRCCAERSAVSARE